MTEPAVVVIADQISNNVNRDLVNTNTPSRHTNSSKQKLMFSEDISDFLSAIDSYNPTLPEAVTNYYLEKNGLAVHDDRISKFVSLASDKFLSEIIYEAKQVSLLRQQGVKNNKRKTEMTETLEMEDVEGSLAQMRIFLRRQKVKLDDSSNVDNNS